MKKYIAIFALLALFPFFSIALAEEGEENSSLETSSGTTVEDSSTPSSSPVLNKLEKVKESLAPYRRLSRALDKKLRGNDNALTRGEGKKIGLTKKISEYVPNSSKKVIDVACVQKALETRERSLLSALEKKNEAFLSAFKARLENLVAAWAITDTTRKDAVVRAWSGYKTAIKSANETFRKEKENIWKTFRTTVKNGCGVITPETELFEEGVNNDTNL